MQIRCWFALAAGCAAFAACDDDQAGDADATVTDAAVADAAVADAAVADAAPADAMPPGRFYAFVTVERWTRGTGLPNTMGALMTYHQLQPAPSVVRIDEHCLVHEDSWTSAGGAPPSYGTVTIDGMPGGSVVWIPDAEGMGFDNTPGGFDQGDVLTVHSTGDEISPFSFTGTVPAVPVLTSHDNTVPGPTEITISRAASFDLTWQPVEGEIFVLLLQFAPGLQLLQGIHCFYPGLDGAASIPVAALAHLQPSPQVMLTNFYFSLVDRQHLMLPEVDLDFVLWHGRQTRVTLE